MTEPWRCNFGLWSFLILCILVTIVQCERLAYAYPHTNVIADPYAEAQLPLELRLRKKNYPVEIHTVTTTDGYILSLYRVRHGPHERNVGNRSVVLLVHGMGASPSMFWLYEKYSLGYYLVDRGFDVWAMCARGKECAHQKKHVKYDWDEDKKYWDFSMHHIGTQDIPAHIDYVLGHTGHNKLHLIGHSAGNTVIFIMLAERPEYNEKVKTAVAYAPSLILRNVDYPLVEVAAALVKILKGLYKMLGLVEFIPSIDNFKGFFNTVCADQEYYPVCVHVLSIIGSHMSVLANNKELLPFLIQDAGFRCSSKQIFHYLECIDTGEFRKYDHGPKKNLKVYGQDTPPKYNLSKITAPSGFFYSGGDSICTTEESNHLLLVECCTRQVAGGYAESELHSSTNSPSFPGPSKLRDLGVLEFRQNLAYKDVKASMDELPNVVYENRVPFRKFTHTDFILAKEAAKWVYEPTYQLIKNYDKGILPPRRKSPLENRIEL